MREHFMLENEEINFMEMKKKIQDILNLHDTTLVWFCRHNIRNA